MNKIIIYFVIILFCVTFLNSCKMNESNKVSSIKDENITTQQSKQENDETDSDDWAFEDEDPNFREKIYQIDLSKSKAPFYDATRKWRVVRSDFESAYYKELQAMLRSDSSKEVEKAIIYFYWMRPYKQSNETYKIVKEVITKNIVSDEKLKYLYLFSVLNDKPKNLSECIWKLRVSDANQAEQFYDLTKPIDKVFPCYKDLKEDEQMFLELAFSYWLRQRLHKPYFKMLVKVGDINDYSSDEYEKLGEIKPMLDLDKNMKKNEYYYELPEFFSFLIDEKYRDSKLDRIINGLYSDIEEYLFCPNEFQTSEDQRSIHFSSYYIGLFKALLFNRIPFFRAEKLKTTKILSEFIENSVSELEQMIKGCSVNSHGELMYNNIKFDDIDGNLCFLYYFWTNIAPLRSTDYIIKNVKDSFWGERFSNYFTSGVSIFKFPKFFVHYKDLYLKANLGYINNFLDSKEILRSIIRNSKIYKIVKNYKKSDWERFFELNK